MAKYEVFLFLEHRFDAKAAKQLSRVKDSSIYHLSSNYLLFLKLEKMFMGQMPVQQLNHFFHHTYQQHEGDLLNFYAELSKKFEQDAKGWWGTALATRSSTGTPLIRRMIYLLAASQLMFERKERSLVFIVESPALLRSIQSEAFRLGRSTKAEVPFYLEGCINSVNVLKILFRTGVLLLNALKIRLTTRKALPALKAIAQAKKRILIRSWITEGSSGADTFFRNRNFGSLPEFLESQGWEVWILPMFFGLKNSVSFQINKILKDNVRVLIPGQHLGMIDFLSLILDGIKQYRLNIPKLFFNKIDCTPLFIEERNQSAMSPNLLELNATYLFLRNLSAMKFEIQSFLYPFENNAPEKAFILGVKTFYAHSQLIGFQHSAWYKGQLAMAMSPKEPSSYPLPNRILCHGRKYLEVLIKSGFPSDRIALGTNLRFIEVKSPQLKVKKSSDIVLLCLLNYQMDLSIEMLHKLFQALPRMSFINPVKIFIKPHPENNFKKLKKFVGLTDLKNIEFVSGSIYNWLDQCDVVLDPGASIALIESLIQGKPVIQVKSGSNFCLDPLWSKASCYQVCEIDELVQALNKAIHLSDDEKKVACEAGKEILQDYFEPVTEEKLMHFSSQVLPLA